MRRLLSTFALVLLLPILTGSTTVINSYRFAAVGGTPTVTSATITSNTAGVSSLNLGYSISVSIGAGGSGGMSAAASGGAVTLGTSTGLPGSSESIPITNRPILGTETGTTRSYTQPGNGREATSGGADLATYTTQSVTNSSNVIVYDDFAGTGALSGNWTDYVAGFARVSDQASAVNVSGNTLSAYTGLTPTSNARATITLRTTPTANIQPFLALRWDGSGGYIVLTNGSTVSVERWDLGVRTTIATGSSSTVSGDTFGFEFSGSTFAVYKNGVSITLSSTTDATYTTAEAVVVGVVPTGTITFAYDNLVIQNLP